MKKAKKRTRKQRVQDAVNNLETVTHFDDGSTKIENLVKINGKWEWARSVFNSNGEIVDCNDVFRKMIKIGTSKRA